MSVLLNTLFVTTQGAYLRRRGATVVVRSERKTLLEVPLQLLGGVACFGRVSASPELLAACAARGVGVSFLSIRGRFLARVEGPGAGSVTLRRAQYEASSDAARCLQIARGFVAGKIFNQRAVLQRWGREASSDEDRAVFDAAVARLAGSSGSAERAADLDSLRGAEGEAASAYFGAISAAFRLHREAFRFAARSRRPPMDRINALMSFLYAILQHDCASAAAATGLDPAVGFLHADRPGRDSLALDLMEELRSPLADRLAVALVNLGQIDPESFEVQPTGAVNLTDAARRTVLSAYQRRKQEEVQHPLLKEPMPLGVVPHVQARLLTRSIRGDLDAYPPFTVR